MQSTATKRQCHRQLHGLGLNEQQPTLAANSIAPVMLAYANERFRCRTADSLLRTTTLWNCCLDGSRRCHRARRQLRNRPFMLRPSWFLRQPARALLGTGAPSSSGCGVGEPPQLRGPGVAVQTRHHIEDWIKGHWGVWTVVRYW